MKKGMHAAIPPRSECQQRATPECYNVLFYHRNCVVLRVNLSLYVHAECESINCVINYTTTDFSFPKNYPYQAWANRYPVPVSDS